MKKTLLVFKDPSENATEPMGLKKENNSRIISFSNVDTVVPAYVI